MAAADPGGGGAPPPPLKKLLARAWCEQHPEWLVVHDCERYGTDHRLDGWSYLFVADLGLDLHLWCVENCRGYFYSYSDPMSGTDDHFAFKDRRDAALFKLFFADRLIHRE